jgi:hypothetical protein
MQMLGGQLDGFTIAAVQDQLLHVSRPSSGRRITVFHAVIVAHRRRGCIGQTTHSLIASAWVIRPIRLDTLRGERVRTSPFVTSISRPASTPPRWFKGLSDDLY